MIKSTFGLEQEPFYRKELSLLSQQKEILTYIKIHSQHGGFSVIIGEPGVGKSVLRESIEMLGKENEIVVISFSRTMHVYTNILKQLALSFKLDVATNQVEQALIQEAYKQVKNNKTLYILIDEAHLLDMQVLRKLRLLFERFPKKHNLVLFGQFELLHYLSMTVNEDIKSRITYSGKLLPLGDEAIKAFITQELETVRLGVNVFDEAAIELIVRTIRGNLRLCRSLCYGSLIACCQDKKRIVLIRHVNEVLIQPHWRSHDELIKQQVA